MLVSIAAMVASIVLNQPNPVYGQAESFTLTVPKAAFINNHNSEQHVNPVLQVDCSQSGSHVWEALWGDTQNHWTNNHDGSYTYPDATIPPFGEYSTAWTSGGADCSAALWSYNPGEGQFRFWAYTSFYVSG